MKQILQVDLEGDGINEVLIVAEDVSEGLIAQDGDYSIAFVRRTVSGDVQTDILGESVIVTADNPLVNSYSVGAVADLNGDARMEIVLTAAYYEDLRGGVGIRSGRAAATDLRELWRVMDNPFLDRPTFVGHTGIELTDASADSCEGRLVIEDIIISHTVWSTVGSVHVHRDPRLFGSGAVGDGERDGRLRRRVQSDRFHPCDHRRRADRFGDSNPPGPHPATMAGRRDP